ncbi:hypothetical protein N9I76_00730 [Candidatus Thioglobus sp.]|nr:hypothetical protein [Candidatus Thioglobus sp.]MDA8872023.1 hypothetical protein [Candidatus Thioglobus sp.]
MKKTKKIIVFITHSLSEINVLFPLFSALKSTGNIEVSIIFTVKKIHADYIQSSFYQYCENQLGLRTHLYYIPNKFDNNIEKLGLSSIRKVFKRFNYLFWLFKILPKLILRILLSDIVMHEFSNQKNSTRVLYLLHAIFKKKILTYHHGNEISIEKTSYGKRINSEKSTLLLFDSHNSNYMKKMGYDKQFVIGYPIFFPEWSEIVNEYSSKLHYENQTVVIYSRHINERYMDSDKYIELLSSSLRVIRAKYKNIEIIIKPHPREEINVILEIIKSQNISNVTISHEHPAVLAKTAKMAITFWGSVILESLSMNVPTVEYYIEAEKFREDYPNGSNYKAVGIHSVSDEKGLEVFIDSVEKNSYELPLIVNEFKKAQNTKIFFT